MELTILESIKFWVAKTLVDVGVGLGLISVVFVFWILFTLLNIVTHWARYKLNRTKVINALECYCCRDFVGNCYFFNRDLDWSTNVEHFIVVLYREPHRGRHTLRYTKKEWTDTIDTEWIYIYKVR